MSSEVERLTKERKVTAETQTESKTHTSCIYKKGSEDLYVIWVKMIDIQKETGHKNVCHVVMKKIKSCYKTNDPTEQQVRKYKKGKRIW